MRLVIIGLLARVGHKGGRPRALNAEMVAATVRMASTEPLTQAQIAQRLEAQFGTLPFEGFVQQGISQVGCGRNYEFLTQTGLPNEFHRFSRLAMITPSRCYESSRRVSSRAPMQRLIREICDSTSARWPYPYLFRNAWMPLSLMYRTRWSCQRVAGWS